MDATMLYSKFYARDQAGTKPGPKWYRILALHGPVCNISKKTTFHSQFVHSINKQQHKKCKWNNVIFENLPTVPDKSGIKIIQNWFLPCHGRNISKTIPFHSYILSCGCSMACILLHALTSEIESLDVIVFVNILSRLFFHWPGPK